MGTDGGGIAYYPQPSYTERQRRVDPPVLAGLGFVFFLLALIVGISFLLEGYVLLGAALILSGTLISAFVWRKSSKAYQRLDLARRRP